MRRRDIETYTACRFYQHWPVTRYVRGEMEAWLVWLIAAVLFAVGEIATLGFFLAPFAGGALVASLLAGLDVGAFGQWGAFLAAGGIRT